MSFDRRVRWSPRLERLESRLLLHGEGPPEHALTDHVHAQLDIFINGDHVVIPGSIGVQGDGTIIETLHTHEAGGRLHHHPINGGATVPTEFATVGDFFDVWRTNAAAGGDNANAMFSSTNIMGNTVNATHTIRMFVNGVPNDEFENYRFHDNDAIVISYEPVANTHTVTLVNINTSQGVIPLELFNVAAPQTVANFLNYVNDGDYVNSAFHRSIAGFIIQAGGFTFDSGTVARVPADPAVVNEPGVSNTAGTIAMAKLPTNPNSATNQWFVNIGDNASNLDNQNGGFTVFGRVIGDGMAVAMRINDLPRQNLVDALNNPDSDPFVSGAFTDTPVVNYNGPPVTSDELVLISSVTVVTSGIEGTKFNDLNANGMQDAGENGLAGWTIYVDANNNGVLDAGETSVVTNVSGDYRFNGLTPGSYIVREVLQPGWVQTTPAGGFHSVAIGGEQGAADVDFGNVQLTAPTQLMLRPNSDTGSSTSDGLTRLNNASDATLQFSVAGLIPGATVQLVDTTGGAVIAQVTADAVSMTIETNGAVLLADGAHSIVARQSLAGVTSSNSASVGLTIDATAPVFSSTPIETALAGILYEYNAETGDEAGGTVVYDLSQGATGMTIDAPTGALRWTPSFAQVGGHTVSVRAIDRAGNEATQPFSIQVTNPAPELDPIANQTVDERATVSFIVTATDGNLAGDMLTFSLLPGAPAGAMIDPATGAFTWTPREEDGPGMFPITVRVVDTGGESDEQEFTVTVNELNVAPTIEPVADRVAIVDMPLTFNVVATDEDLPAQTLTFSLIGAPAGAAIDPGTGEFTWTPSDADSPGTYMMQVQVSDGDLQATQSFTIFVQDEAFAPELQPIDDETVDEQTQLVVNVVANDGNLPHDRLIYSLDAGAPDGAVIDPATGVFTWTPDEADGPGMFQITVRVTDASGLEDTATFNVTVNEVNQPPVIENIGPLSVDEEDTLSFFVNATDPDLPANSLTYALTQSDAPAASIDPNTGQFTWLTTEADGPGTFNFTVEVSDGLDTDSVTFTVTVDEVNQPPVLAMIDSVFVDEGGTASLFADATDPDLPQNSLLFSLGADAPAGAVIDPVTGEFTWLTDEDDGPGTFMITVEVSDGFGGVDSQLVSVTVNEINTAPVLQPIDDETISEGQLFTFTAVATDADRPANSFTFSLDTGAPLGITLDAQTGVFTWTPSEQQGGGVFEITLRVDDGSGEANSSDSQTFTLTVEEVDSPPVLDPIGDQVVNVGGTLTFRAMATDPDIPETPFTFSLDTGSPAGATINPQTGEFSWTPTSQQGTGFFNVTVRVTDSTGLSDFEDIEILVNTPPVIDPIGDRQVNELSLLSFTVTVDDDDPVTFRLGSGAPAGAAIDPQTGLFTWTPTEAQGPGTFDITVIAEDTGGLESEESFEVTVQEVNLLPTIDPIGDQIGQPGTEMQFTVTASDPDLPANNLRFSLDPGSPPEAMIDPVTGLFWWTIPPDITDTRVTFTVRVTDDGPGGLSTTQSFDVLLTNIGFSLFTTDGANGLNARAQTPAMTTRTTADTSQPSEETAAIDLPLLPAGDALLIDRDGSNFSIGPDTGVAPFWQPLRDGPMPGSDEEHEEQGEEDDRVGDNRSQQGIESGASHEQAAVPSDDGFTLLRLPVDDAISQLIDDPAAPTMNVVADLYSHWLGGHEDHPPAATATRFVPIERPTPSASGDAADRTDRQSGESTPVAALALLPGAVRRRWREKQQRPTTRSGWRSR